MNALDHHIQEIAFKIDNEDLGVLLFALNHWGNSFAAKTSEDKMKIFTLRKLRQKMEIRQLQTKGSTKEFKLRVEPVQAFALMNILTVVRTMLSEKSYESEVCRKFRDEIHQKLLAI